MKRGGNWGILALSPCFISFPGPIWLFLLSVEQLITPPLLFGVNEFSHSFPGLA